ncbi:MAG TPA: VOC family protein [Gammaproteobacteria bacterium]|nr:VOC family protein [Gammaproteobacteria bacterium]
MADQNVRGRFIWHELATPDSESAHDFYSDVLGWRKEAWEDDPSYSMFAAQTGPLGGAVELRGAGPHWLPYIASDDIDATVNEAQELGATLIQDVTTIPNGSKYAILADPYGARFAVYGPGAEPAAEKAPEPGEFSWHELATEDWRAAFDFYSRLFGWETLAEHDMGPMGVYLIFGRDGRQLGGVFNKGEQGRPGDAYWLAYVRVPNVHEAAETVKSRGGSVVAGPMEVPGGDWIAQCVDPHGALFAIQTSKADMEARPTGGGAGAGGETVAGEGIPASRPVAEPAKKAAKRAARKTTSKKSAASASAAEAPAEPPEAPSKKAPSKKASPKKAAKKKSAKKKSAKKKSAGKKAAKKKAGKKKAGKKKAAKKSPNKRSAKKKTGKKKAGTRSAAKKAGGKKRGGKKTGATKRGRPAGVGRRPGKKAARKKARGR